MDTPAQLVLAAPMEDDAGSRTADLYDWQASMAAADALSLYIHFCNRNSSLRLPHDVKIVCEHHEDWTVIHGSHAELVSAKHRESESGAWTTVNRLVDKGGLGHLYDQWRRFGEKPKVRLVSCAGLSSGNPKQIAEAGRILRDEAVGKSVNPADRTIVEHAVSNLAGELRRWRDSGKQRTGNDDLDGNAEDSVRRFLAALTIDYKRPDREFVMHAAPSLYARPVVMLLGHSESLAVAVWCAVLELFRARMRARPPFNQSDNFASAEKLFTHPGYGTSDAAVAAILRDRIVDLSQIELAVRSALENPEGYLPLEPPAEVTRLGVKMARGGCSGTSIGRAEMLRSDFREYRRSRSDGPPGAIAEWRRLERSLMRIADNASTSTKSSFSRWGPEMWAELNNQTASSSSSLIEDDDSDIALGGICDLAARCKVWFSPVFDVKAELRRLQAERGQK